MCLLVASQVSCHWKSDKLPDAFVHLNKVINERFQTHFSDLALKILNWILAKICAFQRTRVYTDALWKRNTYKLKFWIQDQICSIATSSILIWYSKTGLKGPVFKENLHLLIDANDDVTKTLDARQTCSVGSIVTKLWKFDFLDDSHFMKQTDFGLILGTQQFIVKQMIFHAVLFMQHFRS